MRKFIFGFLIISILISGILVGIILVKQRQLVNQKAAGLIQHLGQCNDQGCSCSNATCSGTCYIVTNYCPDQAAGGFGCQFNQTTIRGSNASASFNNICGTEQIDMGCITSGGVQTIGESWQIIPLICANHQVETSTPIATPTPVVTTVPTPVITPTPSAVVTSSPSPTVTPLIAQVITTPSPTPIVTPTPTITLSPTQTPLITATPTQSPTVTPTTTSTTSPTNAPVIAQATQSPSPALPVTGNTHPTILGIASGAILLITSLLLIL